MKSQCNYTYIITRVTVKMCQWVCIIILYKRHHVIGMFHVYHWLTISFVGSRHSSVDDARSTQIKTVHCSVYKL